MTPKKYTAYWAEVHFAVNYRGKSVNKLRKWFIVKWIKYKLDKDQQYIDVPAPVIKS